MWSKAWRTAALLLVLAPIISLAEEPVDLTMVNRIRDEAFHHSEVMKTIAHLTDVIGPRLTGSPSFKRASEWTRTQLMEWGLENAHLEDWDFGRGWSFSYASVQRNLSSERTRIPMVRSSRVMSVATVPRTLDRIRAAASLTLCPRLAAAR